MDSGLKSYRDALDVLFARTGATSKFGLERTCELLELLGNPHRKIRTLHVAGTNGKGSVVVTLYTLLRAKGLSVGRYMSPHLCDFRERVVVDDNAISPAYVIAFLDRWTPAAERLGATFFEITTAMAFDYFALHGVDAAVIETGLGGRLDATNVINPLVAGITSISLDHQEFLGRTEEEIAGEKAGIFKQGIPSVIGEVSTRARVAINRSVSESGAGAVVEAASLYGTSDVGVSAEGTSFSTVHDGRSVRMTTGLAGVAQAGNAAVALAMLHSAGEPWSVSLEDAQETLPAVRLPGRFQRVDNYIFDVAHNPDGMRSLVSTLKLARPATPITAVLGVLSDKDWRAMLVILASAVDCVVLVSPPSAPASRAWNPAEALAFARENGIDAVVDPDFRNAVTAGDGYDGTMLITGSFHTVGDSLAFLGINTL